MAMKNLISEIDAAIARLVQARNLLTGSDSGTSFGYGTSRAKLTRAPRKKRVLSPEARARIAAAQKKRWAKQKTTAKAK